MLGKQHRQRGTIYAIVLGSFMLITVMGVGALMTMRIETKSAEGCLDIAEARAYALSAIDIGMWTVYNDANWRTRANGAWRTNQAIGEGTYSLSVIDPTDGVLSDSKSEPIKLTGTGMLRSARYIIEATATAQPVALKALNTCLHATGNVTVSLLQSVTASGAPLSMNGSINGPGTITGTVEAGSTGVAPTIIGTSTIPAAAKSAPDAEVYDKYLALATTLSFTTGTMDKVVLAPGLNPYGALNSAGVYYINGTGDVTIVRSRINGTLIVSIPSGKKLLLDDVVFMHPYRADYPSLIVSGNVEIGLNTSSYGLLESSQSTNYNPAGASYLGVTDTDKTDSYPNELRGLVHIKGNLTLSRTSLVRGVVLVEGAVTVGGTIQLVNDPSIYTNPPMGYVNYVMQIASGSWRRVVN